jgi:DNA helicase-2/ATP-dependent DNA helicase PcrA
MLDLSRLSAAQREAVLAPDGPLLIVAGPGSGKTTVLAARIAYLATARAVPPTSILALTFTTAAARELRARLAGILGEDGRAVDALTFHAFGLRIVRMWSEELAFGPGPISVYGARDAEALLREAAASLRLDLDRWQIADIERRVERLRLTDAGHGEDEQLQGLATAYEALLRRRGAVDYAAMLAVPLRLFRERPDALRLYQDTYRHVLCDELQDVCAAQSALLQLLAMRHRNLVVVGDAAQTLYGWRGADVRFLLGFRREFPEARVVTLDENFRATRHLVAVANALGAPLAYSRRLWTRNPPGEPVVLFVAGDERAEAEFVAQTIAELRTEGAVREHGQVAVLFRTNGQANELALALRLAGIAYRVRGSGDLFTRREVQDAVAYLRLAHDPRDVAALARIVNAPPRRLGRIAGPLRKHPVSSVELPAVASRFGQAVRARAEALVALISDLHQQSASLDLATLLDLALDRSGYRDWVGQQPDCAIRVANLAVLRSLAERAPEDLGTWLAELQLDEGTPEVPDDHDRVLLTTIHGAKGREWRVVFVVGMEEGLLPHGRAVLASPARDGMDGPSAECGIEEELRVAYVAVTRPRERLYLSWCRARRRGDRVDQRAPSRFLQNVPPTLLAPAA